MDVVNFLDRAWDSFSASNISQSPARKYVTHIARSTTFTGHSLTLRYVGASFAASAAEVKITLSLPALLNAVDLGDRVFTLALFLQDTALIDDESKGLLTLLRDTTLRGATLITNLPRVLHTYQRACWIHCRLVTATRDMGRSP